jgi:hypothetical protein
LEELYILLITNKASNILQDIDTLHLFARVVSDMCRSAEEKEISRNQFELMGAFDEIVSLGYREQINLTQVRSVLEMESHEEKIQEIIARVRVFHVTIIYIRSQVFRTKKQKPRKNLSDVLSKWKCKKENNNGVQPREVVWILATVEDLVLYPILVATLLFLDSRLHLQSLVRIRLSPNQKHLHSRVLV